MDRLNIQAHKNAMNSSDEFIMGNFVIEEKVSRMFRQYKNISKFKF